MKRAILASVALLAVLSGDVRAGFIYIDDSGEGIPSVQVDAGQVQILQDSTNEFLHFLYTSPDVSFPPGSSISRDLLEPDQSFSDRLYVQSNGGNVFEIIFASDPHAPPSPGQIAFKPLIEDGTFQPMFTTWSVQGPQVFPPNPNLPGSDTYFVRSDVDTAAVPEPSTLTLLGIGAVCSLGYGWRRRRQSA